MILCKLLDKLLPKHIVTVFEDFDRIFIRENLTGRDRVSFVISFVQNMKYERPGGILDLLTPLGSLAQRYGDCDTKALLLYVLLERMGIEPITRTLQGSVACLGTCLLILVFIAGQVMINSPALPAGILPIWHLKTASPAINTRVNLQ